jgi:antitoxin HicB
MYPIKLTRDESDCGFVVTCRDFPEAITQGESQEDALIEAADCLEEAVAARIDDGREIPVPTEALRGERLVSVPLDVTTT